MQEKKKTVKQMNTKLQTGSENHPIVIQQTQVVVNTDDVSSFPP